MTRAANATLDLKAAIRAQLLNRQEYFGTMSISGYAVRLTDAWPMRPT
jgi:hypothetical protein